MTLSDFNTLAEAKLAQVITYRKIGGNEARQFFAMVGALDNIEAAQTDTTPCVNAVYGMNTTVGQLAKAVMETIKNGQFATDPNTQDGQLNRIASSFLVSAGIYSAEINAAFFDRSKTVSYPYENSTAHDFAKAKGTMTYKIVTPDKGWLKITVDVSVSGFEAHAPQIHADIQGVKRRVAGFEHITESGDYLAQVPMQYGDLYVDNHYGATL